MSTSSLSRALSCSVLALWLLASPKIPAAQSSSTIPTQIPGPQNAILMGVAYIGFLFADLYYMVKLMSS